MNRRMLALAGALLSASGHSHALEPTPPDALGPFYPDRLPADRDNDLVRIAGQRQPAQGREIELRGRVMDTGGNPLPGARIEIWQADAQGHYIHSADPHPEGRDAGFQGFGASITDAAGSYLFRTVEPGAYAGRPPHIHVRVIVDGRERLVTQLYFPGRSAEDGIDAAMASDRAGRQTPAFGPQQGPVPIARFDIILARQGAK